MVDPPLDPCRILVVDHDAVHRARTAEVLERLATECDAKGSMAEVPPEAGYDIIVASFDELLPDDREALVGRALAGATQARLLVISSGKCQLELGDLFRRHALTNVLARNGEVNPDDLAVTVQKIRRRNIFGLASYFAPGSAVVSTKVTRSSDKARVVAMAERYAEGLGLHPRLVAQLATVADELVTNAVYNAPCDDEGKSRFSHLSRADEVVLGDDEAIEIALCSDGRRVGMSARDPFGSLTRERLLDYLARCFQAGKGRVEHKAGGAGLGFYQVFHAVSHLVANLSPGRSTEILGLIDAHPSYRAFAQGIKSFNLFIGDA